MTRFTSFVVSLCDDGRLQPARDDGRHMSEYTWLYVNPYLMGSSDTAMACETATGTRMLLAYSRVTDEPHKAAVGVYLTSAGCAEAEAREAELEPSAPYGQVSEIVDTRAHAKSARSRSAHRLYEAWKHMKAHDGIQRWGVRIDDETDELAWFMGHLAGASSVQHDRAAAAAVNIPLDVPMHAAKGIVLGRREVVRRALSASGDRRLSVPGATPEGRTLGR